MSLRLQHAEYWFNLTSNYGNKQLKKLNLNFRFPDAVLNVIILIIFKDSS
jgi:hypothetical protein